MAKKSQRRSLRYERDQLGCMWGFINMFNFRHGRSPQKLLVDRRHHSKRTHSVGFFRGKHEKSTSSAETFYEGENRHDGVDFVKPSVKKLIEDELFNEISSNIEKGHNYSLGHETIVSEKEKMRTKVKPRNKSCGSINDINAFDQSLKCRSTHSLDIDNMVEEFNHDINQRSVNSTKDTYKERLSGFIKFLISQKLVHGSSPIKDSEFHTSKDLMEAFQILGCDEEFFLKLLQDPDLLVEDSPRVQGLQLVNKETSKRSNSKQCSFFRRKNKFQQKDPSEDTNASEAPDRIVILKPGPTCLLSSQTSTKVSNERLNAHFFFSEVKRKLKHAMGKEQCGTTTSNVFSKQSSTSSKRVFKEGLRRSVPTKDHFFIERMAKPSVKQENGNKNSKDRLSNLYMEAKKHLFEMLKNGEENADLSSKDIPKTLGKIISFPDYLSPLGSPKRNLQQCYVDLHTSSLFQEMQKNIENKKEDSSPKFYMSKNSEIQPCNMDIQSDNTLELLPLFSDKVDRHPDKADEILAENHTSLEGTLITGATIGIEETKQKETKTLDIPSQVCDSSFNRSEEDQDMKNVNEEAFPYELLIKDSHGEIELTLSPPISFFSNINKEHEVNRSDIPARSSPVSVLDPIFSEEDISPTKIKSRSGNLQLQPLHIRLGEDDYQTKNHGNSWKAYTNAKEIIFEYIKLVLECSKLTPEEFFIKSISSDQLLEPSLLQRVKFFPNDLCPDHELLLDSINEALLECCGNAPWAVFANSMFSTPSNMDNIIHKVQQKVYWNVLPLPLPRTLDQIVQKDFMKSDHWMNLQMETDNIGTEAGEIIIDELLEEMAMHCLKAHLRINCSINEEF